MRREEKRKTMVWVDLDNSPHVQLFVPIIKELGSQDIEVIVTARDFAQTVKLLKKTDLKYIVVGKHYGKNTLRKLIGTIIRALQLRRTVRKHKPDIAINHGSRSHVLACWLMGVPCFVGADYEHTESRIFRTFASKMWIPDGISGEGLNVFGISTSKVFSYKGYKEEMYLKDYTPDPDFLEGLNIPEGKILVTLRPPATHANYHHKDSEGFLKGLISFIKAQEGIITLCIPRTGDQYNELKIEHSDSFRVLDQVVNGMDLAYYSDLVISGGGTMNREGALLGTPVYSIFSGSLGLLDAKMEKDGMIQFIRSQTDIKRIRFEKKQKPKNNIINDEIVKNLVRELLILQKN